MTNPTESRERTLLPAAVWFVPAGMLLLALTNLPYDFYALLRVVVCGTALLVVLHEYKLRGEPSGWMVVLVGVALLFNPLFPVGLLRKQWALIDASAAILLAFHYLACKRLATTTPDAPAARAVAQTEAGDGPNAAPRKTCHSCSTACRQDARQRQGLAVAPGSLGEARPSPAEDVARGWRGLEEAQGVSSGVRTTR